jgi:hypothetical protein
MKHASRRQSKSEKPPYEVPWRFSLAASSCIIIIIIIMNAMEQYHLYNGALAYYTTLQQC